MDRPIAAGQIEARPIEFAWMDRLPRGMITVIAGLPAAGKGPLTYRIAADISDHGGRSLISSAEEHFGAMSRPRLEVAKADLDMVMMWQCMLPKHMRQLARLLREPPGFDLFVIDPFSAHLSDGIKRQSDSVREMLTPFKALLEETNTAGLIVEHIIKRTSKDIDPMYSIGGASSGLIAACRMAYLFGSDPKDTDRKLLACVKPGVRAMPPALEFELDSVEHPVGDQPVLIPRGECEFDARKLLFGAGKKGRPAHRLAQATQWLANYLYDEGVPVPAGLVLEDGKHVTISRNTMMRAADVIEVVKSARGGPKSKWSLPDKLREEIKLSRDGGSVMSDDELAQLLEDGQP